MSRPQHTRPQQSRSEPSLAARRTIATLSAGHALPRAPSLEPGLPRVNLGRAVAPAASACHPGPPIACPPGNSTHHSIEFLRSQCPFLTPISLQMAHTTEPRRPRTAFYSRPLSPRFRRHHGVTDIKLSRLGTPTQSFRPPFVLPAHQPVSERRLSPSISWQFPAKRRAR